MIEKIKTEIIPVKQQFIGKKGNLDYRAICIFAATGFFLDDDTYFKNLKVLKPAHEYAIEEDRIVSARPWFSWYYHPEDMALKAAVDEFAELFENVIKKQTSGKRVILPLSGGLDSRTQAAALKHLVADVEAYSYEFQNGHNESFYGRRIAKTCQFSFRNWSVPEGYLWNSIDRLAGINQCYSEFTHPRQMAFIDSYAEMGDLFSLGHWGDVLFDDMGVPDDLPFESQLDIVLKKIVKKGGIDLAERLWTTWGLEGRFLDCFYARIRDLLKNIDIDTSANARIRAFKSLYWAPRWTSTNLSVFSSVRPVTLPYYDNKICEFICKVPEKLLAARKIQIEYIKMRSPSLARIIWQDKRPFNLYNYHLNRAPFNIPYKVADKLSRTISNRRYIQRNWELQFEGDFNDRMLRSHLFGDDKFTNFLPIEVTRHIYDHFRLTDPVKYSHPISMLLTLSLFAKKNL